MKQLQSSAREEAEALELSKQQVGTPWSVDGVEGRFQG